MRKMRRLVAVGEDCDVTRRGEEALEDDMVETNRINDEINRALL